MAKIRLTLACWDYDRTRALQDGRVEVEGVDLTYLPLRVEETFWRMLRYGEFDVAEMSMGSFLMARDKGAPRLIGIPVFPSKTFRHSCIYINTDSGIQKPADMSGKRVGVPEYQITMATWARGILQHEYGVAPEKMKWFTGGEEHPGRQDKVRHNLPPHIDIQTIPADKTLSGMLERGEIDAMISAHMPSPFVRRDPKVRRLIPNFREVEQEYFQRTKIFPIMHTIVIREEVYEKQPWIAQSLFKAFDESKRLCKQAMYEFSALKYMLAWSIDEMEKERAILGDDAWAYGLEPNRHILETLIQYTYEQGLISKRFEVESLFAKSTLEEFKI
ncbi:MAG TPA: PhnD/SsuA/transferrin family substrate-binding protein [Candidatus Eisenbacteria bacterium]|nr:PhnD/SsuA/transferrin family substrate-binding protein [Candidatus Eisenbacteria bacterium]